MGDVDPADGACAADLHDDGGPDLDLEVAAHADRVGVGRGDRLKAERDPAREDDRMELEADPNLVQPDVAEDEDARELRDPEVPAVEGAVGEVKLRADGDAGAGDDHGRAAVPLIAGRGVLQIGVLDLEGADVDVGDVEVQAVQVQPALG